MKIEHKRLPCFYSNHDLAYGVKDKMLDEQGSLFSSLNNVSDGFRAFVQSHFCSKSVSKPQVDYKLSEVLECLRFSYELQYNEIFKLIERLMFDMLKNESSFRGIVNKFTENYCELKRSTKLFIDNDRQVVFPLVGTLVDKKRVTPGTLAVENIPSFQTIALPKKIDLFFKQFNLWYSSYSGENQCVWDEMAMLLNLLERELRLCNGLHRYLLIPAFLDAFDLSVLEKINQLDKVFEKDRLNKNRFQKGVN